MFPYASHFTVAATQCFVFRPSPSLTTNFSSFVTSTPSATPCHTTVLPNNLLRHQSTPVP
ncbi:hypothetical protein E2C01_021857 [Portunus trituberculatus]|uniref:Uncharacterized protein n=1 Tax=Portunus trituberculatus TaxID=210409 RepID=A0A5B7E5P8_PORTR|nr:hypothetical protein [Portunus trituberculatus]